MSEILMRETMDGDCKITVFFNTVEFRYLAKIVRADGLQIRRIIPCTHEPVFGIDYQDAQEIDAQIDKALEILRKGEPKP